MSFDPSTNAAQLARLVARCDYQQFFPSSMPTMFRSKGHPFQAFFSLASSDLVALSWTGSYRGVFYRVSPQPVLCVPASEQAVGMAALLTSASQFLDELDLQASSFGANPNPYAPGNGTPNAT